VDSAFFFGFVGLDAKEPWTSFFSGLQTTRSLHPISLSREKWRCRIHSKKTDGLRKREKKSGRDRQNKARFAEEDIKDAQRKGVTRNQKG
jgi:hypothetical protein